MKPNKKMNLGILGAVLVLALALIFVGGCSSQTTSTASTELNYNQAQRPTNPGTQAEVYNFVKTGPLTQSEKEGLIKMREEEKLARDVYLTLGKKWNLQIFNNIARAEQTHTDAVKALLDYYNLSDPVKTDKVGVFTSPEMQKLYNQLVEQGSRSKLDALKVGATIEDLDIEDLNVLLNETNNPNIKMVYQNLVRGSRNHLRAFMSQIRAMGGNYTPQYISQSLFNQIISTPQEKGGFNY